MEKKLFKIEERKKDAVLLKKDMPFESPHRIMWQVRDIENDVVYMGYDYYKAKDFFDKYDINQIRKEKKKVFEEWLEEFAEA